MTFTFTKIEDNFMSQHVVTNVTNTGYAQATVINTETGKTTSGQAKIGSWGGLSEGSAIASAVSKAAGKQ